MIRQIFVLAEIFVNSFYFICPPILKDILSKICCVFLSFIEVVIKFAVIQANKLNIEMHILFYLVWMLRFVTVPYVFIMGIGKSKKCSPPTNPLLFHSATKLAAMIRHKKIKSEEVIKAYIERCKEVNTVLNAIVEPCYEAALVEAKKVDKFLAQGIKTPEELERELPLLGLPITIKESIGVKGMSNNAGQVREERRLAKKDAECVQLVRAAGAIPLAVTNTSELCTNWESYNNVTGTTLNPYDSKRTCGGSSGGECALISSGASIMGIGSDLGGSIRLPAMFTGIHGHKPSPHVVSTKGHFPYCIDPDWDNYLNIGPITRYAEDLPLLLNAISSPNGPQLQLNKPVNIKDISFYIMNDSKSRLVENIGIDVKNCIKNMKGILKENYNIDFEQIEIKNWDKIFEVSLKVVTSLDGIHKIFSKPENHTEQKSIWPKMFKKPLRFSYQTFNPILFKLMIKLLNLLPESHIAEMKACKEEIKKNLLEVLGDNGVLIHPVFPHPAHKHYAILYKYFSTTFVIAFNCLSLPVTTIPLGLTKNGLPVGVQIVAAPGNDHLTIAVAREMEKFTGGWIPPNSVWRLNKQPKQKVVQKLDEERLNGFFEVIGRFK